VEYAYLSCPVCGVHFALEKRFYEWRKEGGHVGEKQPNYHCPNGHVLVVRDWDIEKLRRERDQLKQQMAQLNDELAAQTAQTTKARKQIVKMQKRAAAGVCPCCNRSFTNMARHMATKHPEFKTADIVPIKKEA